MRLYFRAALLLLLAGPPCLACIHTPASYHQIVTEKTKQALLFHEGRNAHLVIQTDLQAPGRLPDTVAWVIPVPVLPTHYAEADPGLFPELFRVTESAEEKQWKGVRTKSIPLAASIPAPAIRIHALQVVGHYRIRPIEIMSVRSAGSALNRWLLGNGFGAFPLQDQRPYLHKGSVFLAVTMVHLSGRSVNIRPLHIVYPSTRVALPLKLSTNSGIFDVLLYTFTPRPLRGDTFGQSRLYPDGPAVPVSNAAQAPLLAQLTGGRPGYLMRFLGRAFNRPGWSVRQLPADPGFDARVFLGKTTAGNREKP